MGLQNETLPHLLPPVTFNWSVVCFCYLSVILYMDKGGDASPPFSMYESVNTWIGWRCIATLYLSSGDVIATPHQNVCLAPVTVGRSGW